MHEQVKKAILKLPGNNRPTCNHREHFQRMRSNDIHTGETASTNVMDHTSAMKIKRSKMQLQRWSSSVKGLPQIILVNA
jgi:hypothetical protein